MFLFTACPSDDGDEDEKIDQVSSKSSNDYYLIYKIKETSLVRTVTNKIETQYLDYEFKYDDLKRIKSFYYGSHYFQYEYEGNTVNLYDNGIKRFIAQLDNKGRIIHIFNASLQKYADIEYNSNGCLSKYNHISSAVSPYNWETIFTWTNEENIETIDNIGHQTNGNAYSFLKSDYKMGGELNNANIDLNNFIGYEDYESIENLFLPVFAPFDFYGNRSRHLISYALKPSGLYLDNYKITRDSGGRITKISYQSIDSGSNRVYIDHEINISWIVVAGTTDR